MVKYSVLTTDKELISQNIRILEWLKKGIKVICFSDSAVIDDFDGSYKKFSSAKLFEIYPIEAGFPNITIYDGMMDEDQQNVLRTLTKKSTDFNLEQYLAEHSEPNKSHIIEASAGTGKTKVIIDRIMYLLHMVPNISLADIVMITFTNEATKSMRDKMQKALLERFMSTNDPRYIAYLEDESKMRIQTIHSFSKDFISELGPSIGYSNKIKLRGFKYEKKQLIRETLNELISTNDRSVESELGLKLHELENLIFDFWTSLENIGMTDEEIKNLDWGAPNDDGSLALHNTLANAFIRLNCKYNNLKKKHDAITVGDIVRELRRILDNCEQPVLKSRQIKFLFIDEFQDSDNAQIKTIAWLKKIWGFHLFAVGDVKQSIYRFRGAVTTAFKKLDSELQAIGETSPITHKLIKNYRTSPVILDKLDPIFRKWSKDGLLDYDTSLIAQKKLKGCIEFKKVLPYDNVIKSVTLDVIRDCLDDYQRFTKEHGSWNEAVQRVTILARTNNQLKKVSRWCEENQIPCYIRLEGGFFASRAVRDFMSMISAYLFHETSIHKFNYLISAYGPDNFDIKDLHAFKGDAIKQNRYLDAKLAGVCWENNKKAFRLKPVISVIREIIIKASPTERFISIRKGELSRIGWDEDKIDYQVHIEAMQFEKNTEKLMNLIRERFSGDFASLYTIYKFLLTNIQTNRSEDEPDISESIGIECVHGMTVHKSKGLEFDTVIIPFTNRIYRRDYETEILIDEEKVPARVGWGYARYSDFSKLESLKSNNYYEDSVNKEFNDVDQEEARLLYVALTRSIRRLVCLVEGDCEHSWAELLGGQNV